MDNLSIIQKHLSPEVPLQIGEDTILLKPFSLAQRLLLLDISKLMKGKSEIEVIENKDINEKLYDLYKSIILRVIPEIEDEVLENFVMSNSSELFQVIFKLIPQPTRSDKENLVKERIKQVREKKSG
jgi:hypothetical protein